MSTVKSKKLQVGTDASASNNFTIYQPATPDGTLRIGVGNADSPTEVGRFTSAGYKPATAPLVSANRIGTQTISGLTWTKITFTTTEVDTNSNFASSRFTPTVAGYYQVNLVTQCQASSSLTRQLLAIWKNNAQGFRLNDTRISYGSNVGTVSGSGLIYMNGTTDYIESYVYLDGSGTFYIQGSSGEETKFQAFLIQQV